MTSGKYVLTISRTKDETESKSLAFTCSICSSNILFKTQREVLHHLSRNHKTEITRKRYLEIRSVVRNIVKGRELGVLRF